MQHDTKAQFVALAELLDLSLGSENAITDPCSPATLSVFRFASSRLSGAKSFDGASPQLHSLMATDDGGVQSECEMLMLKGLEQLQRVVEKQTKEQNEDLGALETATEVGYSLVESLRHVMQPAAYISGLITIITKTKDAIQRKALRMLDTFVRELSKISGDGIDKNAGDQPEILSSDGVRAAARDAVRCIQPLLLSPGVESGDEPSELTVQLSFTALGSLAQGVGQWEHDTFLGIIDGVLKRVVDAGSVPLRTGALATLAAIVQGLGMKILPKLPAIVSVVLQSAEKTLENDPQTEDIVELELVAMFSVISSLLHRLGAFIAPNLPQLLRLLFCSRVLSEPSTSKLAQVAALIRDQLPKKVPPRLFLPPMAEWLETVLVTSPEAVHFSIDMVQVSISNLDAKAASSFHQLLFGSMMKVLDVRRRGMSTGFIAPEAVLLIEEKASAALVELILKLSEGKFKPLFFRMVEWANATHFPEDSNVAAQSLKGELAKLVRRVAFLSLINALCESLRSVFTPYFHFLMDLIVDILTMEDDAVKTMEARGEEPSLKKQKKPSKKKSSDTLTKDTKQYLMDLYHCRVLAVRALHRCFLYDTSGFLDEARFDRLMTPLVSQLQRAPQSRDFEGAIPADGVIESGSHPENFSEIDVLSRAAICCLSQMALASGPSESRWRPLNHTILMKTRETEAKIRMAALQTAYALANALQEEYLPLLPEALPFLAELLEDPEPEIEAQATATVKLLEEISGEDLKEYLKV